MKFQDEEGCQQQQMLQRSHSDKDRGFLDLGTGGPCPRWVEPCSAELSADTRLQQKEVGWEVGEWRQVYLAALTNAAERANQMKDR